MKSCKSQVIPNRRQPPIPSLLCTTRFPPAERSETFRTDRLTPSFCDASLPLQATHHRAWGIQPYEVHLITNPDLRDQLALACNGQRAARSAQALVVFVVGVSIIRRRMEESRTYYQSAPLPEKSRQYHLSGLDRLSLALNPWLLPFLGVARSILSVLQPSRSLLPLGQDGAKNWAARASMLAAQTMLFSASAHGVDACPMEGFNGAQVAQALCLPRGTAPTLVVALGYRAEDARIEPRYRRTADQMITTH